MQAKDSNDSGVFSFCLCLHIIFYINDYIRTHSMKTKGSASYTSLSFLASQVVHQSHSIESMHCWEAPSAKRYMEGGYCEN